MGNKEVLQKLFPLKNIGGHYDALMTVLGNELDTIQARADDLLLEAFPDTTTELLSSWEKAYGLKPDDIDTVSQRRKLLLYKINELGGLSEFYYYNLAYMLDVFISIKAPTTFKVGIDKIGDSLGAPFTWLVKMNKDDRHRFPFQVGISKVGDPLVTYDKRNSLEEIFIKLKLAYTDILFDELNLGFEKGNFDHWIQSAYNTIDTLTVHEGTYSCKFEVGTDVEGALSHPIHINPNITYQIESWHNVSFTGSGKYVASISFYSDKEGKAIIGSAELFATTSLTVIPGWNQDILTLTPDVMPEGTKCLRIKQRSQSMVSGIVTAYLDDITINFA